MDYEKEKELAHAFVKEMKFIYDTAKKHTLFSSKKLTTDQSLLRFDSGSTNSKNIKYYYSITHIGCVKIYCNDKSIFAIDTITANGTYISQLAFYKERRTDNVYATFNGDIVFDIPEEYSEENFFQDMLVLDNEKMRYKILYMYLNKYFYNNAIRIDKLRYLSVIRDSYFEL